MNREAQAHEDEPDGKAEGDPGQHSTENRMSFWQDLHVFLNYLFSEHWIGLTILAVAICCVFIYLAAINLNPLWWACIGTILFVDLILFAVFAVAVKRSVTTTTLPIPTPASQPPPTITPTSADERLPGMSLHLFVRVHSLPRASRKYILDLGHLDGERLSIYISKDNIFTLSFVDAKGEVHPIQVPLADEGFPVGRFAYLCCELGISGTDTKMRMAINGKDIGALALPFRTDIGGLDLPNGVIGADLAGQNSAAIDLSEIAIYGNTLTAGDRDQLCRYMTTRKRDKYVEFRGSHWMRIADVSLGSRNLLQPNEKHRPIFRVTEHGGDTANA